MGLVGACKNKPSWHAVCNNLQVICPLVEHNSIAGVDGVECRFFDRSFTACLKRVVCIKRTTSRQQTDSRQQLNMTAVTHINYLDNP